MPEHKMVIIDGVRYRPEDAPERPKAAPRDQSVAEPEKPKRASRAAATKDDADK